MLPQISPARLLALSGAIASSLACTIPDDPLPNTIMEKFSIFVQNPSNPLVHNYVMNFRANGEDEHLVLRPNGVATYDTMWLENGYLRYNVIRAVIDLEYDDRDDTTKMFMTERTYHPAARFQPVYGCDPDTDALQIRLQLVARETTPEVLGGQIGIREVVGTYEFRYSPPNNPLLTSSFIPVTMVIFRDGVSPPPVSTTTSSIAPAPTPPSIDEYDFVSCWSEPDGGRTLPTVYRASDMTNQKCAGLCLGTTYFGTQWTSECWCGPSLAGGATAPAAECDYTCGGDHTQICGGGRRLSLYHKKDAGSVSTTTSSAPASSTTTSISSSSTTVSSTTTTVSSTTTTVSSTTTSASPTTTSISTTLSTSTTSASSTTTSAGTTPSGPAIGPFSYVSCWAEPPTGRTLTTTSFSTDDMTNEKCSTLCASYQYFGTQWSRECFCGNALTSGSAEAPASECDYKCTGNAAEICGGSRRLSLYKNPSFVGPSQPAAVGSATLLGCVVDSVAARTLSESTLASSTMTLERCSTFCAGYKYFGTEYSAECYCGNTLRAGRDVVDISQCSMTCSGNNLQFCGNGDRLSVYQRP